MKVALLEEGQVEDAAFWYGVTAARYRGKWIFCRHRDRDTWELPGGRREPGEAIFHTARRELYEETGAVDFTITPVCPYSVTMGWTTYGMLYYARVEALGPLPESEIAEIRLFDELPEALTYSQIQPLLLEKVKSTIKEV